MLRNGVSTTLHARSTGSGCPQWFSRQRPGFPPVSRPTPKEVLSGGRQDERERSRNGRGSCETERLSAFPDRSPGGHHCIPGLPGPRRTPAHGCGGVRPQPRRGGAGVLLCSTPARAPRAGRARLQDDALAHRQAPVVGQAAAGRALVRDRDRCGVLGQGHGRNRSVRRSGRFHKHRGRSGRGRAPGPARS